MLITEQPHGAGNHPLLEVDHLDGDGPADTGLVQGFKAKGLV
ncbi:hypothetical protein [Actinoplanes sp. GCM10030250]